MSCAINSGYVKGCKSSMGGLRTIWIAMLNDIASITETAGEISDIVMKSGKVFFGFELAKDSSYFNTDPAGSITNGTLVFNESLTLVLNEMKTSTSILIQALAKNSIVVIAEDRNRRAVLLGRTEGIDLESGTIGSGTSSGDRNGYELNFTGNEPKISHLQAAYLATFTGGTDDGGEGTPETFFLLVNEGEFLIDSDDSKIKYS